MKTEKIFFRYKHDTNALKLDVYNLMTKSYIELGQKPDEKQIKLNASLLFNDLIQYYKGMTMNEVEFVFHKGIRNAEEGTSCFINVRQWNVWLKNHKNSEALKRQQKVLTDYERYEQDQKLIAETINKAKRLK